MCRATLRRRRLAALEHVLDEVDAAARAVELVAEQHVGRAGRVAEAAMDAGAQDAVRVREFGIGELGEGEMGLHSGQRSRYMRPRIEDAARIELQFDARR